MKALCVLCLHSFCRENFHCSKSASVFIHIKICFKTTRVGVGEGMEASREGKKIKFNFESRATLFENIPRAQIFQIQMKIKVLLKFFAPLFYFGEKRNFTRLNYRSLVEFSLFPFQSLKSVWSEASLCCVHFKMFLKLKMSESFCFWTLWSWKYPKLNMTFHFYSRIISIFVFHWVESFFLLRKKTFSVGI